MTLVINENYLSSIVVNNLFEICPDPNLEIDLWEIIEPDPETGELLHRRGPGGVWLDEPTEGFESVGRDLLLNIIRSPGLVGIKGYPGANELLMVTGILTPGIIYFDRIRQQDEGENQQTREAHWGEIFYDVYNCHGHGWYMPGADQDKAPIPPSSILFHELAHAKWELYPTDPEVQTYQDAHVYAMAKQNEFHQMLKLPQLFCGTEGIGVAGWCGDEDVWYGRSTELEITESTESEEPPQECGFLDCIPGLFEEGYCFIATAAYGSPIQPEVEFLRHYRDNVLRRTRIGESLYNEFYKRYSEVSPTIVKLMEEEPRVREMVRWALVTPIVQYLQIAHEFPDSPIDKLDEPWKSYITGLRDGLENWSVGAIKNLGVGLPENFDDLSPAAAVNELAVILKYVFRQQETRKKYLQRLKNLGQLPLKPSSAMIGGMIKELRRWEISKDNIEIILGPNRNGRKTGESRPVKNFFGKTLTKADINPEACFYILTIVNASRWTWKESTVRYNKTTLPGHIFIDDYELLPPGGEKTVVLGTCLELDTFGFGYSYDDGDEEVTMISPVYTPPPYGATIIANGDGEFVIS